VGLPDYDAQKGDRPYQVKLLLEGITNKGMDELTVLARSWLQAPQVKAVQDCREVAYEKPQRAYVLTATGGEPEIALDVVSDHPLYNPAFVVSNWGKDDVGVVRVKGQTPAAGLVRQGVVRDTRGRQQLIVWLEGVWADPQTLNIKISGAASK